MKYFQVLLILTLLFSGCKKTPDILFCEGVSPEGEGTGCGTVFTTGDLTALYAGSEPFGVDRLTFIIYEKLENKQKEREKIDIRVIPDESRITATLSFYNEGEYHISITKNNTSIAGADVTVVDK